MVFDHDRDSRFTDASTLKPAPFYPPLNAVYWALAPFHLSVDEVVYFDYFRTACTGEFSSYFHASLWKQIVLQAAHMESFILNAILAIGALRRSQLVTSPTTTNILEYCMYKYELASAGLARTIRSGAADSTLTLLGSLVFLAIEVLLGHEAGALMHLQSGVAILRSLPRVHKSRKPEKFSPANHITGDLEVIVGSFERLNFDQDGFIGVHIPNSTPLPSIPSSFKTLSEATDSLNYILTSVNTFFHHSSQPALKTLPLSPLPVAISTHLHILQTHLQSWHQTFTSLTSSPQLFESPTPTHYSAQILQINHLIASIKVSAFFHSARSQITIYASHLPTFIQIFNLTASVVDFDNQMWKRQRGPCYTLDIAMLKPLRFVVDGCQDKGVRERAIEVMRRVGREGGYEREIIKRFGEWGAGRKGEEWEI